VTIAPSLVAEPIWVAREPSITFSSGHIRVVGFSNLTAIDSSLLPMIMGDNSVAEPSPDVTAFMYA